MKKLFTLIFILCSLVIQAQNFTVGNLVVTRVGDGATALSSTTTAPITLLEYSPAGGSATKTLVIPSTGTDKITVLGATTGEGQISLSQNGLYLSVLGYDQATAVSNTTAQTAANLKVIGRIDNTGVVNYTTKFPTSANGSAKNAFTDDGTRFWTGINNFGYVTLGQTTTPTQINGSAPNRVGGIVGNQLYSLRGFSDLFYTTTALPTGASTTAIALSLSVRLNANGFVFFDTDNTIGWNGTGYDLLYISNSNTGLEKYYFDGTYWKSANTQCNIVLAVTNGGSGYTSAPTITIGTPWVASTAYTVNQQITNGGNLYTVTTAGTSGATAPVHTSGAVANGTATLTFVAANATATATISGGVVDNVGITFQSGYLAAPTITLSGGGGSGAVITASLPNNAINAGFGPLAQITGKLVGGKPTIYAVGGSGTSTNNSVYAITDNSARTATMTNALTPYTTIATAGANYAFRGISFSPSSVALPISLLSFNGSLTDGDVKLLWKTATETNAREFEIEKSFDAVNFEKISKIPASNKIQGADYELIDKNVGEGIYNYYRLKMIDIDDKFEYSRVIALRREFSESLKLKVYPNPVGDYLMVSFPTIESATTLSVVDATGSVVIEKQLLVGSSQYSFDISPLQHGNYIIRLMNEQKIMTSKIIK